MTALTRGFGAFQHRNYRLYFAGQSISLIGTWIQTIAQAWLVLTLTHSATDLGIVTALQTLPMLVLGWFGGAYADRMPKQRLLLLTQAGQMILAFILGVLVATGSVQIWHVYVLALLLGSANAFDAPTRQAFVIEMVGRGDLLSAIALNSTAFNLARIVGPGIAGILIELVGVTSSFYINGLSFLFVIGGLLLMRTADFYPVEASPRTSIRRSMAEGLHYVRHTPAALLIITIMGVMGTFAFTNNVVIPLFAESVLHVGAVGLGTLFSAMGLGSIIAGVIAAFAQKARWARVFVGGLGMVLAELAFSLSRNYPLSIALAAVLGFCMFTFITSSNTGMQQRVPDKLRGRVMGIYMTVNMGSQPFGNAATGALAGAFGAPVAMAAGALAGLVGLASAGIWLISHRRTHDLALSTQASLGADGATEPATAAARGRAATSLEVLPATLVGRRLNDAPGHVLVGAGRAGEEQAETGG